MIPPVTEFLVAACVPREGSHTSGTLDAANAILAAHPGIASVSVHAAAALGDDAAVERHIEANAARAVERGAPWEWSPLTCLCFSRFLRHDAARSGGFVRAARLLLDSGADANDGWWEQGPGSTRETVLYGAAGVAHHAGVTRLLLERGANPNDDETPYHTPESYDNGALLALVECGRLSADNMAMMLLRKADVHDHDGMRLLLEHGADPNRPTRWGFTALEQAVRRDNALETITLLLAHGANPTMMNGGQANAMALAACRGRGDLLRIFAERGYAIPSAGVHGFHAACAMGDEAAAHEIVLANEHLHGTLATLQGTVLAQFAANDNVDGLRCLLALGVPVDSLDLAGDAYFDVAPDSTALHVASWRASHHAVRLLLEGGANANARDGAGRTPLALAIRACVDSYWQRRRAPGSVAALLDAGASTAGIALPTGYDAIDRLLGAKGA